MDIIDHINEINPEALLLDGFDKATIGICERINLGPVVAYDIEKILKILCKEHGMTYEDAMEYYNFNIAGAWMGDFTPVFVEVYEGTGEVNFDDEDNIETTGDDLFI